MLEGVVLATRPYFQMFNEGIDVRYAYFDPPMSTNLERIAMRQAKKGHVSPVNHETMEHKQTQAHLMYIEAKRLDLKTKRFWKSPVNATPWILGQLRTP